MNSLLQRIIYLESLPDKNSYDEDEIKQLKKEIKEIYRANKRG